MDVAFAHAHGIAHRRLQNSLFPFGLVNQMIIRETPMLVQWLLRNEYGKQFSSDEAVRQDKGEKLNSSQLFIFESVVRFVVALDPLSTP